MTTPSADALVGPVVVLGLGFTGVRLATRFDWPAGSLGASRGGHADLPIPAVRFDWGDETTWHAVPGHVRGAVITIPPVLADDIDAERRRLERWCAWMSDHRAACRRVLYVSSTGVYPQRGGVWGESGNAEPDTDSGRMRLMSERVLADRFDARIVRAGGIYGPGRNIITRTLEAKPAARSDRPVHRIHVHDLARICREMLGDDAPHRILNAVDNEAATSRDVLLWAAAQPWCPQRARLRAVAETMPPAPRDQDPRVIDASRLRSWLPAGALCFATFREGLADCMDAAA